MGLGVDEAFDGAGAAPGMQIWRIEKLKVVKQDPDTYGNFYSGDSYIVLVTKQVTGSSKLEWDIHFWLGKDTSQDEKGVAAYKTVELDEGMGGGPVQHREVQDHESKKFLSYFKAGIRYLEGGVESGFKKVERDKYETRLMQIKGKRNVRVRQVECHCSSLNQGDVFILDCGLVIYVWNGPFSSKMERIKGAEVAKRINDEERGGRAAVKIIENGWDSDPGFYKALGSREPIKAADDGGDDTEFERTSAEAVKLFRVSDESGSLEVTEVGEKPLKRDHLDSSDCFILDSGPSGIYAWIGKKCTKNEKKSTWQNATVSSPSNCWLGWHIFYRNIPSPTLVNNPVVITLILGRCLFGEQLKVGVSDASWVRGLDACDPGGGGGETPLFKQYFSQWTDRDAQTGLGTVYQVEKVAKQSNEKFNTSLLHDHKTIEKKDQISTQDDDGSGKLKVWRVEHGDLVAQPEESYGNFYSGDCYLVLYTFKPQRHFLYFWQGAKSSWDEKGASAIFTQRMNENDLNGTAVQIRVVQGREPEHFLLIFKGKMVIFLGGINNKEPESSTRLFQVRGTRSLNTKAVQVLPRAGSLNSNDVFIADTEKKLYLWIGVGASEDEKTEANTVLQRICPGRNSDLVVVDERKEPEEFWEILGGPEPYATGPSLENQRGDMPPRLFQCSNATGRFFVEEIVDFSQEYGMRSETAAVAHPWES
ncbi:hypothetical protein ACOMHN_058585 [Nucella lapillus]